MTPNRSRIRWVIADPDTGAVIAPEFAVAIDLDRLTPEQIDAATDASELDMIPADVIDEAVMLASLLADGLRWRAWLATPYGNSPYTRGNAYTTPDEGIRCPACELAENRTRYIDIRTAVVVPWDVMGDPRAYALVCPECADGWSYDENDQAWHHCGQRAYWDDEGPTCSKCQTTQYTETNPAQCSNCGNEWGNIAPMDDEPSALLYCADCRNEYEAAEVDE